MNLRYRTKPSCEYFHFSSGVIPVGLVDGFFSLSFFFGGGGKRFFFLFHSNPYISIIIFDHFLISGSITMTLAMQSKWRSRKDTCMFTTDGRTQRNAGHREIREAWFRWQLRWAKKNSHQHCSVKWLYKYKTRTTLPWSLYRNCFQAAVSWLTMKLRMTDSNWPLKR